LFVVVKVKRDNQLFFFQLSFVIFYQDLLLECWGCAVVEVRVFCNRWLMTIETFLLPIPWCSIWISRSCVVTLCSIVTDVIGNCIRVQICSIRHLCYRFFFLCDDQKCLESFFLRVEESWAILVVFFRGFNIYFLVWSSATTFCHWNISNIERYSRVLQCHLEALTIDNKMVDYSCPLILWQFVILFLSSAVQLTSGLSWNLPE
jgi:hypothetical protein